MKKIYVPLLFHAMLLVWLFGTDLDAIEGLSVDKALASTDSSKLKFGNPFPNNEPWNQSVKSTGYVPQPLREFSTKDKRRISRVQPHIRKAAAKYGVSPDIINGIIWVESNFLVKSRGYRGSRGLMQLMPRTSLTLARELKLQHRPFEPSFNIEAGALYFSQLLKIFDGNIHHALAAYKQGPSSVRTILRSQKPIPGFSRRYAQRVLTAARTFRERGY